MKKIYTTIIAILAVYNLSISQGVPGFFEVRVIDHASQNSRAVVQMRAISTVVPLWSDCMGQGDPVENFTFGVYFALKWPVSSGITEVNINGTNNAGNLCPDNDNPLGGYNMANGGAAMFSQDGLWKVKGYIGATGSTVPIPTDWVLNQWMTICTVSTVGTVCTDCSMLNIYSIGEFPLNNPQGLELFNIFSFNQTGSNPVDYNTEPGALPLDLVSFTAEKSGNKDALTKWTTVNEVNTSHFVLQRSYNKTTWLNVGEVEAAGFSTEIKNYSFTDYEVYNGRDAKLQVYYRLNMIDTDGSQKYSPIKSVVFGNNSLASGREFTIFPNPASEGVHVEWDANQVDQPTTIELFDVAGKLILSVPVSDQTNQQYIDFRPTRVQSGLYLMRIMHNDEALEHKQIVVGRTN